jgi:serine protease AprX
MYLALAMAIVLAVTAIGVSMAVTRAQTELVPVIVRATSGGSGTAEQSVRSEGGEVGQQLAIIEGFAATVPATSVSRLSSLAGIAAVTSDAALRPTHAVDDFDGEAADGSMYNVGWQIGARNYWTRGFTGAGVDVAVIDSGVSPVKGLRGSDKLFYGPDFSFERRSSELRDLDTYGHGTHMAGIIAGFDSGVTGSLSQNHDDFIGIAPGARIVSVKVANAVGATDVSQVIAAIDWVVAHRNKNGLNIRVLNLSFGTDGTQDYTLDPLSYAVEQAWHKGIVVVVAGGNTGFGSAKLNNPAYNPYVIAVGADNPKGTTRTSDDIVPDFSSRGDNQRNPDVVAPGRSVVSLRVPGSHLDLSHPEGRVSSRLFKGSGTSQAAAVVSGAAALILEQRPNITPDQLKQLLTSTAVTLPEADTRAQGNGLIRLGAITDTATNTSANQNWARAQGNGSLEDSRGTVRVKDSTGTTLIGEIDIFGRRFSDGRWENACEILDVEEPVGVQTVENTTDVPCVSWSGNSWSSDVWAGNSWSGNSWSGDAWSGNSWSGNSWSGNSWSGNSWSGNSWSGNSWSSSGWLGVSWGKRKK